jgi:hypothetical protein
LPKKEGTMAKKVEPVKPREPVKAEYVEMEGRVEDIAIEYFEILGYVGRLPKPLYDTYREFKKFKDKIHPGPLSPEALVTVLFLSGVLDKDF